MTTEHPITPPPDELVEQWRKDNLTPENLANYVATQAARWGADQELEAVCEWFVRDWTDIETADKLRAARRPKPPSLKEQALEALDEEHADMRIQNYRLIRSVLESLPS